MNQHGFTRLVFLEKGRSPFTLSLVEVLVAVFSGIFAWLAMCEYLSGLIPFGSWDKNPETYLPEVVYFRTHILGEFALPFVILAVMYGISFVRSIRNDVRHFSRLGHLAVALQSFFSLSPLVYFCFPFGGVLGLSLAIIATFRVIIQRKNMGNLIALPVSIASIIVGVLFWSKTTAFWT